MADSCFCPDGQSLSSSAGNSGAEFGGWNAYSNKTWASQYYELFEGMDDDRTNLTWEGRFENVVDKAFNFYSSGDEVFETTEPITATTGGENGEAFMFPYSWQKNEVFKGKAYGVDWIPGLASRFAGWKCAGLWRTALVLAQRSQFNNRRRTSHVDGFQNNPPFVFQCSLSEGQFGRSFLLYDFTKNLPFA